ncbi:hypothetical protein Ocin01_16103 [Orchesella cincta]|uniref:Uncharacterized protein n=1 Tax=Orchesella cincta TaxID=48709 RepID=A0A1D2MC50_ORCCI|nr:hypothetical protein Ocin01_16103 [Orchesella cincta]
MKQVCAILFLAACVFATAFAFPAAFEDEADYLRTARQIIQGRVSRSPQMGYYGSYPVTTTIVVMAIQITLGDAWEMAMSTSIWLAITAIISNNINLILTCKWDTTTAKRITQNPISL